MGLNQWRGCDRWPPANSQPCYLSSSGLAGMRQDDGLLSLVPPHDMAPSQDVIVHDPWRPVPSLGGHCGLPPGPFDRAAIDCRTDVLTYTTAPLTASLTLMGTPTATLYCCADNPSFDLSLVLSEVHSDGRVMHLTQGYRRVTVCDLAAEEPEAIALPLQPTAYTLFPGHRLRLSVAAACFPAYAVNSGTGQPPGDCDQIDHQIISVTLASGALYPSRIDLPIGKM